MAQTQAQKVKGNPAHKRIGNTNLKARRARSWANGENRKDARRRAQDAAHRRNLTRGYTTWDEAKNARRARRAN